MPRTKRTPQQEDDKNAFLPTQEQIAKGCEEARKKWKGTGARRKLTDPPNIREYNARELGLEEPWE